MAALRIPPRQQWRAIFFCGSDFLRLADESGPSLTREVEAEEDGGFASLLFVGRSDADAFLVAEEGEVEGAGDMGVGEFRGCPDVGDRNRPAQRKKFLDGDRTRHGCKYTFSYLCPYETILWPALWPACLLRVDRARRRAGGAVGFRYSACSRWSDGSSYKMEDVLFADHGYDNGNVWGR